MHLTLNMKGFDEGFFTEMGLNASVCMACVTVWMA